MADIIGNEYARRGGSYSTIIIGTWELIGQDIAENYSTIRSHLYFYYGGGSSVGSSSSSFGTMGVTLYSGSYRFYPGATDLGYTNFRVYHNNDGTFPETNIGFWANSYHFSSAETWGKIPYRAVPDIPRQATVTGFGDFNDEQNPTITYTNPGGFRINARLEFGGTSIRRDNISNTGSYTFNLTDEERNLLRSKCPNSNTMTVRGVIATCISGTTENYWSYWDRTLYITNANPTFNNFNFEDVNPVTLALTGNNQNIIQNYSNVKVTVPIENKAIGNKYATISKYQFNCGNNTPVEFNYSADNDVSGTMQKVPIGTFIVYAVDSRKNTTGVTKLVNKSITYNPLSKGNITIERENGVSEYTRLTFNGTLNIVDFGAKVNKIKIETPTGTQYNRVNWSYKTANTEWTNGTPLTINVDEDGNFDFNGLITADTEEGFNINNSYQIRVIVEDELSSIEYTANLSSGIPNIALAKNGVGIMGKYDEEVGGDFQIRGKNPFIKDYAYVYSNKENLTTTYSKTWTYEKIDLDKSFIVGDYFEFDSSNNRLISKKDIKKIKIKGKYNFYNVNLAGDVYGAIFKNGSNLGGLGYFNSNKDYNYYNSIDGETYAVDIKVGDYFEMKVGNGGTTGSRRCFTGAGTHLIIEVLEE